jgi:hypothetical protein
LFTLLVVRLQFIEAAIHRSRNSSKQQFIEATIHQMAFSLNAQFHLVFKTAGFALTILVGGFHLSL